MPLAAGWALRRIREAVDRTPLAHDPRLPGGRPDGLPPRRLRARAGAAGAWEYFEGGRQAAAELEQILRAAGRDPAQLDSVLDFGCGAGRVLGHFAAVAPGAECSGCDVDQAAIAWATAHRRDWQWSVSSFEPPLPYDAGRFELVYSISVFSHLGRGLQDRWLRELHRVLAPGGVAMLSVHGPHAFDRFRSGAVSTAWCPPEVFARGPLQASELVFAPYVRSAWNIGDLPGVGREYGLAFHGSDYVRDTWSPVLPVIDVHERALTGWQDVVVCAKP